MLAAKDSRGSRFDETWSTRSRRSKYKRCRTGGDCADSSMARNSSLMLSLASVSTGALELDPPLIFLVVMSVRSCLA